MSKQDMRQARAIEQLLDGLASLHSTSERRIDLLAQLEQRFGMAVLGGSDSEHASYASSSSGASANASTNAQQSDWWNAQSRPRSCVALGLVSLLHRLHLVASLSPSSSTEVAGSPNDPSDEMTACFTMLQGLCLKDVESGQICASRSTLELVLAILGASYWQRPSTAQNYALAHGIDLLICATMASRRASALFDDLEGEDVIRTLMQRHTVDNGGVAAEGRRTITLDAVQGSPIAIKCAEFLLLFASERDEPPAESSALLEHVAGQTSIIADSSMVLGLPRLLGVAKKQHNALPTRLTNAPSTPRPMTASPLKESATLERSRRARSVSPTKMQGKRQRGRVDAVEAEGNNEEQRRAGSLGKERHTVPPNVAGFSSLTAEESAHDGERDKLALHRSPIKSYPPPSLLTAGNAVVSSSPAKAPGLYRARFPSTPFSQPVLGRSNAGKKSIVIGAREPLGAIQNAADSGDDLSTPPMSASPSKATFIGPSPAVRRAHARSVSPQKRSSTQSPHIDIAGALP